MRPLVRNTVNTQTNYSIKSQTYQQNVIFFLIFLKKKNPSWVSESALKNLLLYHE